MKQWKFYILLATLVALLAGPPSVQAETITLRLSDGGIGQHDYFIELLTRALEEAGHQPIIEEVKEFPHLRARDMVEHGTMTLIWLMRSKARDAKYIPIPVKLTNGLIGKRILLVSPHKKDQFKNVNSVTAFRNTSAVGGFGTKWYDTQVWKKNNLPYKEITNPNLIYAMIASQDRGITYFSRGFNEIVEEADKHPEVIIEPHIMLEYDSDFVYYLTPARPELAPILTDALTKARDSGLMDILIKKYWGKNFEILKPEDRTVIKLQPAE